MFNAVVANRLVKQGKKVLVLEKRRNIGGNCYTHQNESIIVHKYGPHIFHTNNEKTWLYVNLFADFNNFINSPVARYKDEFYNLPFSMNTFTKMWSDVKNPEQAKKRIQEQSKGIGNPRNLEEKAISLVGYDIYEKLIKGYTEKQWGRKCSELSADIISRLPVRFTFDNNYFNDRYQGVPAGGYTPMIEKMYEGAQIIYGVNYTTERKYFDGVADKIVYTGDLAELFDYCFGELEYRSLTFKTNVLDCDNFQGNAVVNYTSDDVPYTRIIEHKHFDFGTQPKTVITYELPKKWKRGDEPYYPLNNAENESVYRKYKSLADKNGIIVGGRLGLYKYLDMDKIIEIALSVKL